MLVRSRAGCSEAFATLDRCCGADGSRERAAKNYVEEEKRRAREAGIYSGFDS